MSQSVGGGRSQDRQHLLLSRGDQSPEWPDQGPEATWLQQGLGLCPEHTKTHWWLRGQQLAQAQVSVQRRLGLVITASFLGRAGENAKIWYFVHLGLKPLHALVMLVTLLELWCPFLPPR